MTTTTTPRRDPPHPPIDPRIRERRIAVTRDQGRRRLRTLLATLSTAAVVLVVFGMLHSPWLSVSHITVRGAARTGASRVVAAASGALHHPLVSVDTAAVAGRVEALPWVASVRIERSWPSSLVVVVTERVAVAQVATGRSWALVDASGRVLAIDPGPSAGTIKLAGGGAVGPPGTRLPARLAPTLAVAAELARAALPAAPAGLQVAAVRADGAGGVALDLAAGMVVDLGPATNLGPKLGALQTLEAQVDLTGVKTVDLRVPDQPALSRG